MALLGIVLVMIFTGLHTTSRSWESGVRQAQENDDYRLVLSFIRREINETIPIIYLDSNNRHVIFRGERNSLQFVSRLPAHRGGAGLYLVAFDITKDKGMSSMIFHYQPLNTDTIIDNDQPQGKSQFLIENISSAEFSYFGNEKPGEGPTWHDEWKEKGYLPRLIRLRLSSTKDDLLWPELFMRVPAQVERGQPELVLSRAGQRHEG